MNVTFDLNNQPEEKSINNNKSKPIQSRMRFKDGKELKVWRIQLPMLPQRYWMDKDLNVYDWDACSMKETTRKRLVPAVYKIVEEPFILGRTITREIKTSDAYFKYPHLKQKRVTVYFDGWGSYPSPFYEVKLEVQKREGSKVRTKRYMVDYLAKHALPEKYWPRAVRSEEHGRVYRVASVKQFCKWGELSEKYVRELLRGAREKYRGYTLVDNPAFSSNAKTFRKKYYTLTCPFSVA